MTGQLVPARLVDLSRMVNYDEMDRPATTAQRHALYKFLHVAQEPVRNLIRHLTADEAHQMIVALSSANSRRLGLPTESQKRLAEREADALLA